MKTNVAETKPFQKASVCHTRPGSFFFSFSLSLFFFFFFFFFFRGAGTTQLIERPAEKPGAVLTRVRVLSAARDFSPRVSFKCRLS